VYLRFVSFGDSAEADPVPELGPYAVVVVGRRGVEADGDSLATRAGTNLNLWELTGVGGSALVGVIRPDIAFRTRSTTYHPEITPFRRGATPAPMRPVAAPVAVAAAPAAATRVAEPPRAQRPPEDPGLTLRDRIGAEPSTMRSNYMVAEPPQREWGGAAWQLRYAIIGEGPERVALEGLAARLGVAERVDFHGQLAPAAAISLSIQAMKNSASVFERTMSSPTCT